MNKQINNSPIENDKSKITILVAEDHVANFKYLEIILTEKNYNVIHAKNGQEALKLVEEEQSIELILMDIRMPIMDGLTACKLIRKINPSIPIIMQSGDLEQNILKPAINAGCNAIIIKPFSKSELFEIIEKQLKKSANNE